MPAGTGGHFQQIYSEMSGTDAEASGTGHAESSGACDET